MRTEKPVSREKAGGTGVYLIYFRAIDETGEFRQVPSRPNSTTRMTSTKQYDFVQEKLGGLAGVPDRLPFIALRSGVFLSQYGCPRPGVGTGCWARAGLVPRQTDTSRGRHAFRE